MISVYRRGLIVLCVFAGAHPVFPALPERSVSTSRQFLVYGADVRLRGALCDLAERTKRDVLQLIDRRDEWTTPVVVNAQHPQANLPEAPHASLNFAQTGFGLKLQLDLTIASDVRQPEVRRELLRAILLEMMYRHAPNLPAGAAYVPPPDWLLDGIPPRQADFDRGWLIDILRAPVAANKTPSLEEFLRSRKLSAFDAPGRLLYRAYSFALVELLTQTPEGRVRLARFIADIPSASNDPRADLGIHFPEMIDANSAETAWSSRLAWLVTAPPFQFLSAAETEQKLAELLVLRMFDRGAKKHHLDEFPRFVRSRSSTRALEGIRRDLNILATRACPVYRPLIQEYEKIAALLARGKTHAIAERLGRLSAARKEIATQVREIDDYMNWFEATGSQGPSGMFSDYLKAAEPASRPDERRRDPISVYLDVLETQFQN